VTKEPCAACGSMDWRTWRCWYETEVKDGPRLRRESCDRCAGVKPSFNRDAAGNRVAFSNDLIGKRSYATGEVITSQRQYADTLKRQGLIQK